MKKLLIALLCATAMSSCVSADYDRKIYAVRVISSGTELAVEDRFDHIIKTGDTISIMTNSKHLKQWYVCHPVPRDSNSNVNGFVRMYRKVVVMYPITVKTEPAK